MPAHTSSPAVVLDDVTYSWPDGTPALSGVSSSFGARRTGLVGRNGSGKSTLLRLIAGDLVPDTGHIIRTGATAWLPQRLTLETSRPVADAQDVGDTLRSLRAIESGDVAERHFDVVGDDWDVEARAHAALAEAGLSPGMLERRIGEVSGGEAVLIALTGIRLSGAAITLLDEPTNNLDRAARERVYDMAGRWTGALLVVSHDTRLLDLVDDTAELYDDHLTVFGGGYTAWRAWLDAEQDAARRAERVATQAVKREKRDRIAAETVIARRASMGRKAQLERRVPKIVAGNLSRAAQVSAAKLRGDSQDRESHARAALASAEDRVRDDETIIVDLPDPQVAAGRRIATIGDAERTWVVQGRERVALSGPNGAGKTTLLERLVDPGRDVPDCAPHARAHTDRIGYMPQRVDGLDEDATVLDAVRDAAPSSAPGDLRNRLARFRVRGDAVTRPISTLSGGERFRVALARLLLADPPSHLIVLDEPTNNLDLDTVDRLVEALAAYRGALVIVSHDEGFLDRIGIDLHLELTCDGRLSER